MADATELSAYQKLMAALTGAPTPKKKKPSEKPLQSGKVGATCTPAGQPMWPGGTRCPPKGALSSK